MIDINNKYVTRCGFPVRILCTDRKSETHPVIGLIMKPNGEEMHASYREDGFAIDPKVKHPLDLELVPPEYHRWEVVFYTENKNIPLSGGLFSSEADALKEMIYNHVASKAKVFKYTITIDGGRVDLVDSKGF